MRHRIGELNIHATPKAEEMFRFAGLSDVEFEFPARVRTVLFIHCGLVQASKRGLEDHYEVVGRLYEGEDPEATGEDHTGKLHIFVHGHPDAIRFRTEVVRLEWHADGSFDMISEDGRRTRVQQSD